MKAIIKLGFIVLGEKDRHRFLEYGPRVNTVGESASTNFYSSPTFGTDIDAGESFVDLDQSHELCKRDSIGSI